MSAPISPERTWRAALAEGKFLLQRAKASGTVFFPPRLGEPGTGDTDFEWIEASGLGTVYSVTVINQKPPLPAYNVVLVDLDDHVRMMSRVDGAPVTIGMRVQAKIVHEADAPHIVFEAA